MYSNLCIYANINEFYKHDLLTCLPKPWQMFPEVVFLLLQGQRAKVE